MSWQLIVTHIDLCGWVATSSGLRDYHCSNGGSDVTETEVLTHDKYVRNVTSVTYVMVRLRLKSQSYCRYLNQNQNQNKTVTVL